MSSKRRRNVSISTVVILILAAIAGVTYYLGTPPSPPSAVVTTNGCPGAGAVLLIPQGIGSNASVNYEPPTLTVVVGVNNTVVWDDQDSSSPHVVYSVSVPPNAQQWYIPQMVGGNTYCITLTAPGTYNYAFLEPTTLKGSIVVKA